MNSRVLLAALLLPSGTMPAAQPVGLPDAASRLAARESARAEALASLKQGNSAAAIARLRAAASRNPRAPAEGAQVVSALCSLARELEAATPGAGRETALAAVAEGRRAVAGLNRRDAAVVELQLGELRERTLGDPATARAHYQAALTHPATATPARRSLERLTWRDRLIVAKARENAALRARGQ